MCENVINVNSHLSRLLAVVPHDISEKLKSQISVGSVGRLFLNNSVEYWDPNAVHGRSKYRKIRLDTVSN